MLNVSQSRRSQNDIRKRQHLMERSFAQASRYGFDRARWRRLWRVQIQEYLVAAVQNIKILIGHFKEPRKTGAMKVTGCAKNRRLSSNPASKGLLECFLRHLYAMSEQTSGNVAWAS